MSFYPTLHKKLFESNDNEKVAVKLEKVIQSDNEYKLDAETRFVESIAALNNPYKVQHEKVTPIEDLIYELDVDAITSIKGQVLTNRYDSFGVIQATTSGFRQIIFHF